MSLMAFDFVVFYDIYDAEQHLNRYLLAKLKSFISTPTMVRAPHAHAQPASVFHAESETETHLPVWTMRLSAST